MARDLSEQEKAFVEQLAADTGRDLSGWMDVIATCGLTTRNDIIDWLRHQGFNFSNASWLERIHHNGGRLIYGDEGPRAAAPAAVVAASSTSAGLDLQPALAQPIPVEPTVPQTQSTAPPDTQTTTLDAGERPAQVGAGPISPDLVSPDAASLALKTAPTAIEAGRAAHATPPAYLSVPPGSSLKPVPSPQTNETEVSALMMAAKGLRPLAELVLREMEAAMPGLSRAASPPFITLVSGTAVAALLPGPKELRLFADFGSDSRDRTRKAEAGKVAAPFNDVLILKDARQVDDRFRELVQLACARGSNRL